MEVVKQICHKVVFLKNGKLVAEGKPEDLFIYSNKDIQEFSGEHYEILPSKGFNLKLFFTNENSEGHVITEMARNLGIDFDIVQGKLENFRGQIMGSLILNIQKEDAQAVYQYLLEKKIELICLLLKSSMKSS